jgi:hypothetical protein
MQNLPVERGRGRGVKEFSEAKLVSFAMETFEFHLLGRKG